PPAADGDRGAARSDEPAGAAHRCQRRLAVRDADARPRRCEERGHEEDQLRAVTVSWRPASCSGGAVGTALEERRLRAAFFVLAVPLPSGEERSAGYRRSWRGRHRPPSAQAPGLPGRATGAYGRRLARPRLRADSRNRARVGRATNRAATGCFEDDGRSRLEARRRESQRAFSRIARYARTVASSPA